MNDPKATILAVDDSQDDLLLIRRAFQKNCIPATQLQTAENGLEALAYLKGTGQYADRAKYPFPKLVLLDLKMPRVTGFEVLERLREQPLEGELFVVVFSSSAELKDKDRIRELGAFAYEVKPTDFNALCALAQRLCEFFRL
jgi:CheY-like chemotaxis protein